MTFLADLVKQGRVGVETLHLTEKLCALFLAVNMLSAALGVNSFAYTKTSEFEFDFGWNGYERVLSFGGDDKYIREFSYDDESDCLLGDPCSSTQTAGTVFLVMGIFSLFCLWACVIITLEMALFRFTSFTKKVTNAALACTASLFVLIAWANYLNSNDCSAIAKMTDGEGDITYSSSIWYCVAGNIACIYYAGLVVHQNYANWKDKQDEDRDHADPIPALPPVAANSKKHKDPKLSEILNERISTPLPTQTISGDRIAKGNVPPPPNRRKISPVKPVAPARGVSGSITKQRGPPPLPPRESLPAAEMDRQTSVGVHKRRPSLPPTPIKEEDGEVTLPDE